MITSFEKRATPRAKAQRITPMRPAWPYRVVNGYRTGDWAQNTGDVGTLFKRGEAARPASIPGLLTAVNAARTVDGDRKRPRGLLGGGQ
jgi:hypothetical protein